MYIYDDVSNASKLSKQMHDIDAYSVVIWVAYLHIIETYSNIEQIQNNIRISIMINNMYTNCFWYKTMNLKTVIDTTHHTIVVWFERSYSLRQLWHLDEFYLSFCLTSSLLLMIDATVDGGMNKRFDIYMRWRLNDDKNVSTLAKRSIISFIKLDCHRHLSNSRRMLCTNTWTIVDRDNDVDSKYHRTHTVEPTATYLPIVLIIS